MVVERSTAKAVSNVLPAYAAKQEAGGEPALPTNQN